MCGVSHTLAQAGHDVAAATRRYLVPMRARGSGTAVALVLVAAALVGAGLGYALGLERERAPEAFAGTPVPASSPSYPVTPAEVEPDDPRPSLRPGLRTRAATVGAAPFEVRIPVPRGWFRSDSTAGEWRWYPYPPTDENLNLYFVRVSQVGQNHRPVPVAVADRVEDLRSADEVDDFSLESQEGDRFVASYVAGKHRRVSYEGFLPRDGAAYLRIAVIGREADREGLADLFDRLMSGTRV